MSLPEPDGETLLRILQFSVSPAVLVSAAALLLSPAVQRLGRAIDRCRALVRELDAPAAPRRDNLQRQLRLVHARAQRLKTAITCYGASLFLSCLMVFTLFLKVLAGWQIARFAVAVFALDVLALVAGTAYFLLDLTMGLQALDLEVEPHLGR
jgi:hypothetical protein